VGLIERIGRIFSTRDKAAPSGLTYHDLYTGGYSLGEIREARQVAADPDTAMRVAAVMACVRILSETLASVPLVMYERLPSGGKRRAEHHPLYWRLHDMPNDQQTSFEWREMLQAHLALRGNAYFQIIGTEDLQLVPLHPDRLRIDFTGSEPKYIYRRADSEETINRICHIRGLCCDGRMGLSPISYAAKTIGLARKAESYGESVFASGGAKRLVLKHPGQLGEEAAKRLRETWAQKYGRTAATAVLEEGMDAVTIGMSAEDAQYLETRKFQITEIARLYRIPPHMLADLERATFSNIEHQSLEFIKYTMLPWFRRWEQALMRALGLDPRRYFIEFLVDGLLRGDAVSRARAMQIQFMHGALSIDEWRALENRNPLPDGLGQYHYVPVNLQRIDLPPKPASPPPFRALEAEEETESIATTVHRTELDLNERGYHQALRKFFAGVRNKVIRSIKIGNNGHVFDANISAWKRQVKRICAKHYQLVVRELYRDPDDEHARRVMIRHALLMQGYLDQCVERLKGLADPADIEATINEIYTELPDVAQQDTWAFIEEIMGANANV